MKKKALIMIAIVIIVVLGGAGLIYINNEELISSNKEVKYITSLERDEEENDKKVIISHNKIENIELLNNFLDNINGEDENKVSDSIVIVTYTIEGDEIIKTIKYSKEEERYEVTVDNLGDRFASEEDRKVETKIYSDLIYNISKKTIDDYVYLTIEEDPYITICFIEKNEEFTICAYNKELETNKVE